MDDGTDAVEIRDEWQRQTAVCPRPNCGGYGEHNGGVETIEISHSTYAVRVVNRKCSKCGEPFQEHFIVCRAKRVLRPKKPKLLPRE